MTEPITFSIKGYTEQSEESVKLVNNNKEIEERLLRICEKVINHVGEVKVFVNQETKESTSIGHPYDARFARMAISHFQEGFMCLNRAIFNPTRVRLPEDPV